MLKWDEIRECLFNVLVCVVNQVKSVLCHEHKHGLCVSNEHLKWISV